MSITVDSHELTDWIKGIDTKKAVRGRAISEFGKKAETTLRRESAKAVDTGKLFKSIDSVFKTNNSGSRMSTEMTAKAKHAKIALETGRGPGGVKTSAVVAWAMRKGMSQGAGFAIAKSIARTGTRKYKSKGPRLYTNAVKKLGMTTGSFGGSPVHKMITKIAETYE